MQWNFTIRRIQLHFKDPTWRVWLDEIHFESTFQSLVNIGFSNIFAAIETLLKMSNLWSSQMLFQCTKAPFVPYSKGLEGYHLKRRQNFSSLKELILFKLKFVEWKITFYSSPNRVYTLALLKIVYQQEC